MRKPILLDLFCGAGGCSEGYHRAGFEVVGVDIEPQKHYPYFFIQADALQYVAEYGHLYDAIHASPPCQGYSVMKHFCTKEHAMLVPQTRELLVASGKPYVIENVPGAPLICPLILCGSMFNLQTECGAQLRRHRLFESNIELTPPGPCKHGSMTILVAGHDYHDPAERMRKRVISVHEGRNRDKAQENAYYKQRTITVGGEHPHDPSVWRAEQRGMTTKTSAGNGTFPVEQARIAMGIDWMPMKSLSQAIPPEYTHWIGRQLISSLQCRLE